MPTSIQNTSLSSNSNQAQEQPYESLLNDEEIEYLFKTPHSLPMPSHVTLYIWITIQRPYNDAGRIMVYSNCHNPKIQIKIYNIYILLDWPGQQFFEYDGRRQD